MRQTIVILLVLLLSSCSPKVFPVQRDTVTLVWTEIVERLVRDTVEVILPQDSVHVQTRDTMSVLCIKAAISEASVSRGVLTHSLHSNPAYKPEIEVVYKDRIEYRDTTIYASNTVLDKDSVVLTFFIGNKDENQKIPKATVLYKLEVFATF